jgi:hypothetical protein
MSESMPLYKMRGEEAQEDSQIRSSNEADNIGSRSLVSTTEELLDRKVAAPV